MFKVSESVQTKPDLSIKAKDRRNADSDLARWVASAVRSHGGARKLRGYEREALEQEVALRILRATPRTGRPRDVLAWIDRCERMPATAARVEASTRTTLGAMSADERARVLWRTVTHALEARSWQEHSARYRAATRSQRDTGPMVQPSSGEEGSLLALSLDADSARHDSAGNVGALAPMIDGPWSSIDVAGALAYGHGWTAGPARNVALAIERARRLALADSGRARASATDVIRGVAAWRGVSVNAVEAAASRGVKLLTGDVEARELLSAIRHSARLAQRGEKVALAAAAERAVHTVALTGGSWDSESIHSERAMPDREARVNVRMEGPVYLHAGTVPARVAAPAPARVLHLKRRTRPARKPVVQVIGQTRPVDAPTSGVPGPAREVLAWIDRVESYAMSGDWYVSEANGPR